MRKTLSFITYLSLTITLWSEAQADAPSERTFVGRTAWVAIAGDTLEETLREWTYREGWSLVWDSGHDFRFRAGADLGEDFVTAVRDLADAVSQNSPDLTITLYLGNRVVHVSNTGLTPK